MSRLQIQAQILDAVTGRPKDPLRAAKGDRYVAKHLEGYVTSLPFVRDWIEDPHRPGTIIQRATPHNGLDLGSHGRSVPLLSPVTGTVYRRSSPAFDPGGTGHHIVVRDDDSGYYLLVGHLREAPTLDVGTRVERDVTFLGNTGMTGFANGIHAHCMVFPDTNHRLIRPEDGGEAYSWLAFMVATYSAPAPVVARDDAGRVRAARDEVGVLRQVLSIAAMNEGISREQLIAMYQRETAEIAEALA